MKVTGKIHDIHPTFYGKVILSFEVDGRPEVAELADKNLDIDFKVHRERRGLHANAYFHVLCDKIAKVNRTSLTEVKNWLIAEHGQFERDQDGKIPHLVLDDSIDWKKVEWLHLYPTTKVKVLDNGRPYRVYLVRRGSHTYDTKEMSQLIDATVEEAKFLGIETLPPAELERMKKAWEGENNGL